jgi:hypothetical protein
MKKKNIKQKEQKNKESREKKIKWKECLLEKASPKSKLSTFDSQLARGRVVVSISYYDKKKHKE